MSETIESTPTSSSVDSDPPASSITMPPPAPSSPAVEVATEVVEEAVASAPTRDDVDNARRFVAEHGHDLRYCVEWRKWLAWDGVRWMLDPTGAVPMRRAIMMSDQMLADANSRLTRQWAIKSREVARLNAVVQIASVSSRIAVPQDAFDADPMILVTPTGTIDLRTGLLRENRRKDLSTKVCGTRMDPTMPMPNWRAFLDKVTRGEVELQQYLQRVVGYLLTGDVSEQVLFFFFGVGSNGKGTFLKTLMEMLGDYAQPAARGLLEQSHSDDHPTHIAALRKARLAVCSEVERDRELAEALVKDLTGDDKLSARRMREDFWYFDPTHKVILQGQHKPIIRGEDDGIWRRVHSMPWLARFKADDAVVADDDTTVREERIYSYYAKFLRAELPGILAWAVEGCIEWQRVRLSPPLAITTSIAAYKAEMFNVPRWMKERVIYDYDVTTSRQELREDYMAWAMEHDFPAADERQFLRQMRTRISEQAVKSDVPVPTEIMAKERMQRRSIRAWRHIRLRELGEMPDRRSTVGPPSPETIETVETAETAETTRIAALPEDDAPPTPTQH